MHRLSTLSIRLCLVVAALGVTALVAPSALAGPHPPLSVWQASYDRNVLEITGSGYTPGGEVVIYLSDDSGHAEKLFTRATETTQIVICEDPVHGQCHLYPYPGGQIALTYEGLCDLGWGRILIAEALDLTTGARSVPVDLKVRCG